MLESISRVASKTLNQCFHTQVSAVRSLGSMHLVNIGDSKEVGSAKDIVQAVSSLQRFVASGVQVESLQDDFSSMVGTVGQLCIFSVDRCEAASLPLAKVKDYEKDLFNSSTNVCLGKLNKAVRPLLAVGPDGRKAAIEWCMSGKAACEVGSVVQKFEEHVLWAEKLVDDRVANLFKVMDKDSALLQEQLPQCNHKFQAASEGEFISFCNSLQLSDKVGAVESSYNRVRTAVKELDAMTRAGKGLLKAKQTMMDGKALVASFVILCLLNDDGLSEASAKGKKIRGQVQSTLQLIESQKLSVAPDLLKRAKAVLAK